MSIRFRIVLLFLMSFALLFGFIHLFVSENNLYNFERLHIFLFNLCSGGTILLYYTEDRKRLSMKAALFCILAVGYAICAFLETYVPAMLIGLVLATIVEMVRIQKFSVFPTDFFRLATPVSEKFHQASLICLSIGLLLSSLVILNNQYVKVVSFPKLQLDTFFLGFSFPVSLVTISVMFALIENNDSKTIRYLKNVCFWSVNIGVIVFFLFILLEKFLLQFFIALILFVTVAGMFYLFYRFEIQEQQKNFFTSGMFFLLFSAVTGLMYILWEFFPAYGYDKAEILLKMHSFASLYGWNLSGLAVLCRYHDFPINLQLKWLIGVHWMAVIIFAPLAYYFRTFAFCAITCYVFIVYIILFSRRFFGSHSFETTRHGVSSGESESGIALRGKIPNNRLNKLL